MQIMKTSVKYFSLFCLIILSSISCKKEITYTLPTTERKIVVNSFFSTERLMRVDVYSSSFVTDKNGTNFYLNNATVSVYGNGSLVEVLPNIADGTYQSSVLFPQQGVNYTLEVVVPNMGTATSSVPLLYPVPVLGFDSVGVVTDEWNQKSIKTHIKIKDNPDEENYYHLTLWKYSYNYSYDEMENPILDSIPYTSYLYVTSNDPVFEAGTDGILFFSDVLINGKEYDLEVLINEYEFDNHTSCILAVLEHISRDYYRYSVALPKHFDAEDLNMFMEAVIVQNNIENGVGIFGTSSQSTDTLYNYNFENPIQEIK
jgi:hypothetical protein